MSTSEGPTERRLLHVIRNGSKDDVVVPLERPSMIPPRHWQAVLYRLEGKTFREIGETQGLSMEMVRRNIKDSAMILRSTERESHSMQFSQPEDAYAEDDYRPDT